MEQVISNTEYQKLWSRLYEKLYSECFANFKKYANYKGVRNEHDIISAFDDAFIKLKAKIENENEEAILSQYNYLFICFKSKLVDAMRVYRKWYQKILPIDNDKATNFVTDEACTEQLAINDLLKEITVLKENVFTKREKTVFELATIGKTHKEIATQLNISVSNSQKILSRARKKLKEKCEALSLIH